MAVEPKLDPRGLKRICMNCGNRFYDLNKRPIVCPSCETEFTGDVKVKTRKSRVAAATAANDPAESKVSKATENETEDDDDDGIEDDGAVVSFDALEDEEEEATDIDDDEDDTLDLGDDIGDLNDLEPDADDIENLDGDDKFDDKKDDKKD